MLKHQHINIKDLKPSKSSSTCFFFWLKNQIEESFLHLRIELNKHFYAFEPAPEKIIKITVYTNKQLVKKHLVTAIESLINI